MISATLLRTIRRSVFVGGAGLILGLSINGVRYESKMQTLRAEHAETLQAISEEAERATANAMRQMREAQMEVARLDARYTEELSHAESENERLRDAVADGNRRLRIKANCPAGSDGVSKASPATGQPHDGTVELDRETGSLVLDLRRDLMRDRAKILGLQHYVREVCGR